MLVGEAWGEHEDQLKTPFVGPSGSELNRMLHEVGLLRSECFTTNLINARPPENDIGKWIALKKKDRTATHVELRDKWVLPIVREGYVNLLSEIDSVEPNIIVAFGNAAMWALTGLWGVVKWRGSHLRANTPTRLKPKVIPTYHPAAILRQWDWRAAGLSDLRRVKKQIDSPDYQLPEYNFALRPSFAKVTEIFDVLVSKLDLSELWLDVDIETRAGHIACIGLSWSRTETLTLPLMCLERREGYWSDVEEAALVWRLRQLLTHPNVRVRWQNGLYDAQYIWKHWHFVPRGAQDTMISQHALFSDLPKALHFQASLYAQHYVYWKDEGKKWEPSMGEEQHWRYNSLDCVYTREVGEVEQETAKRLGLEKVHTFQQAMFWPVLRAMQLGIRVIPSARDKLLNEVEDQLSGREDFLREVLGHPLNPGSPKQMQALFYDDLNQPPVMTRPKKGSPAHVTCDDEALQKIAAREPLLKPITNCIADIRTLGKFRKDFILAPTDSDGRMRCSWNIGGSESGKSAPKTYRLSSSKSAFGSGANLQTIPSEKSKSVGKWQQRGHVALLGDPFQLPNLRSMYGPDLGHTFFDMDLDRADLQVMAWDADEPLLKEALKKKVDLHLLNVYVLDQKEPPPLEELVESHPKYPDHRGPRKHKREFAKVFCHATDYLGKSRTVAAATGRSIHEVDKAQKIYLGTYKGIEKWQQRVIEQVKRHRFVENKFGYRWYIFDRIDDQVMPEAVAWIPQSTVSIIINRIWMALFLEKPESEWTPADFTPDALWTQLHRRHTIDVLLQVHDSLAGQFKTAERELAIDQLKRLSQITVPYEDPLIIPIGIGTSEVSWGEC